MKILFYVFDLTHFKTFGPIIKALKHSGLNDITFLFTRRNSKYNGFGNDKNFNTFLNFANFFEAKIHNTDVALISGHFDYVFTVENQDYGCLQSLDETATQIIIQNGFDYTQIRNKQTKLKQKFVLASRDYEEDYRKISTLPCVYLPIPVTYCDWEYSKKFGEKRIEDASKNITIFYPESGYTDLVDKLISKIFDMGLTVSIKQRRKNQSVAVKDSRVKVFYDEQWFPSESIFLPLNSICSVGFGTSAYVDATVAGLNFIDVPLPSYAQQYLKPKLDTLSIIDVSKADILTEILNSIEQLAKAKNVPVPADTNYEQMLGSLLT